MLPSTPTKTKPKDNKPVTPRKGCEMGVISPHNQTLIILYLCYPFKLGFIYTLESKNAQEANELLVELHEFNYNSKNGLDRTDIQKFYILWLMNWFSDGIIRKQKATLHRREIADFPKECFIINFELN